MSNISNNKTALAETTRIEAFSDGVFAIIITLLVLEIHRPDAERGKLAAELLREWPSYCAYLLAFFYVGIIWLNHHGIFKYIAKADLGLNVANLIGLGATALLPFPTGVMATAFRSGDFNDQKAAVVLYAIVAGLMSAAWLPIFPYLHRHPHLLKDGVSPNAFAGEVIRPIIGVTSYSLAALLGWLVHPLLALALFVFMIIYHAWTCQGANARKVK